MRRLPPWLLAGLVVVSGLLVWIGWVDRHEAGYLPLILGIAWSLFTLASIGGAMSQED